MQSTTDTVRISGKLSIEDLQDVGKVVRSKWYWHRLLLANWYGLALLLVLLWGTVVQIERRDTTHLLGLSLVWLVVAAIFAWALYRSRLSTARDYSELEKNLPDSLTVAPDGVHFDGPDGARAFSPWAHFKCWREGRRVIVLDRSTVNGFAMLPVSHMQAIERESLRRLLGLYLPRERN